MPIRNSEAEFGNPVNPDDKPKNPKVLVKRDIPPANLRSPSAARKPDTAATNPRGELQAIRERIAAAKNNINQAIIDGRIVFGQTYSLAYLDNITGLSDNEATGRLLYSLQEIGFSPVSEADTYAVIGYKYETKKPKVKRRRKNKSVEEKRLKT